MLLTSTSINRNQRVATEWPDRRKKYRVKNFGLDKIINEATQRGLFNVWSVREEQREAIVNMIPLLKKIAGAEITQDGDDLKIQVNWDNKKLTIVQTSEFGETVLKARLGGVELHFLFHSYIAWLQVDIKSDLKEFDDIMSYRQNREDAATVLAKNIRRFNVTGVPEPCADVSALRDSKGRVVGFERPDLAPSGPHQFGFVEFPAWCPDPSKDGGNKRFTHANEKYVGLTLKSRYVATLDPRVLNLLKKFHRDFTQIVPQLRVNTYHLISPNLGPKNMVVLCQEGYILKPPHVKKLAGNMDRLHWHGIVNRDTKPTNILLKDSEMCLTDLDSMGFVGSFSEDYCTPSYVAPELRPLNDGVCYDNVSNKRAPINAFKRAQYSFMLSMVAIHHKMNPSNGKFPPHLVFSFVQVLPCHVDLKKDLYCFLLYPLNNQLHHPMADYF